MEDPTWWTYFKRIAGTEVGRVIAEAASVSEPQVSRWKSGKNRPDAEALVRFARYYKRPPMEALVAAGYLSADEVNDVIEVAMSSADLTADDLIDEMRRRIGLAESQTEFLNALSDGAKLFIGLVPHSPGVSISRVGDDVTANLVIAPENGILVQPALKALINQENPHDLTEEPSPEPSTPQADEGKKTGAGHPRDDDTGTDPEGHAADLARPNVWREKPDGRQSDHDLAARRGAGKTKGELLRERDAVLGEESQIDPEAD